MVKSSQPQVIIPVPGELTLLRNGEVVERRHPLPVQGYPHKVQCPYCGQIQVLQHGQCFACDGVMGQPMAEGG
jgi:hypothetical protein